MDPAPTQTSTGAPPPAAGPIPVALYCALWIPAFAVVLYFMMRLFGPRAYEPEPPHEPDEPEVLGEE